MKTYTCNAKEAVAKSYENGFSDGYDAALVALEAILKGIGHDSDDPLLQGMKNTKKGAYEYMGCPPELEKLLVLPNDGKFH